MRAVVDEFAAFARGNRLDGLPALDALLSDHETARAFVDGFNAAFLDALRGEPLAELPFRHARRGGFARLELIHEGGATLSLAVYEPLADTPPAATVRFADCAVFEMVVSGSATGQRVTLRPDGGVDQPNLCIAPMTWRAGDRITCSPRSEARQFDEVSESLLILQLSRSPVHPLPTRDYDLASGAKIKQTSGDRRASEQVMALAVLGSLDHGEALTVMRAFACDMTHDREARWEAVRQVLAVDSSVGMALLSQLASNQLDSLAEPASDLHDQLMARHPSLAATAEQAS